MKKVTLYRNCLKKGFILMTAVVCVGTFSGCGDGLKSDSSDVESQVNEYKENHIRKVFLNNFTFSTAKMALSRCGIKLSDAEIEYYLDMYKGANPVNQPDYDLKQIELEASILAEQNRINKR